MCSHTKAAAQTLLDRWGKQSKSIDVQTLHSFCFKATKCSRSQTVDDQRMQGFLEDFGLDMDEGGDGRKYVEAMAYHRAVAIPLDVAYDKSQRPGTWHHFKAFVDSYTQWKNNFGYVDFTDMLERYVKGATKGDGYTLIAVDEAQDLTPLHWLAIEKIMAVNPEARVLIAGDDDQCIYGYTGAIPEGAANFSKKYTCDVRVLEQSYRVPARIHDLAQRITRRIEQRVSKNYLPRGAEGMVVYNDLGFEYSFQNFISKDDLRDCLILYSDKFIRREQVEQTLMDLALPFTAVSGFPAPLQTKGGQALRLAHKEDLTDDEAKCLLRGLSDKGAELFKAIGPAAVCERLRRGDYSHISVHWSSEEYFRRLDWGRVNSTNIRISTIHGAKGMEAETVHLITGQSGSAVDHSFRDPDSAHRLMYVGATRASETLCIYPGYNNYEMPRVG